jgi:hypothetical protein
VRFKREAQAAAAVCHDHIVTVHSVDEADGLPYLVMQYVAGESLQDRLDRTGPLELIEIVRIGLQTASGLAAAHAQGLIHRDIKPANILLENGLARVRITDFGLARMMADHVQLTQQGAVHGTPEYMAPEQARGETVDHRADLFSLGSVLYAMCTGVPPFTGSSTVAVLRQVSDHAPTPIRKLNPNVPEWLESLTARLMANNPTDRIQTAAEVATLLEGYLAHLRQPGSTHPPDLPSMPMGARTPRALRAAMRRWRPLGLLVAGVLLAAVVLGVGMWLGGGSTTPELKKTAADAMQEFHQSFKAGERNLDIVERTGPDAKECVQFEAEGVRITLPKHYEGPPGFHGERPDTGVILPVGVKGDFEITVHFEILEEPDANDAGTPQTRFSLDTATDRSRNINTMLSRRVERAGGMQYTTWVSRWNDTTGKNDYTHHHFPTGSKKAALRMVRAGDRVAYYVMDHPGQPFALLRDNLFTADTLEDVRLTGSTGKGEQAALDVLVTDVRIRAASLILPETEDPASNLKLWVALGIAVAFALFLTMALLLTRRHAPRLPAIGEPHSATGAPPAEPGAPGPDAAAPVFFLCDGCGKKLKAKANLAGKKVKCPRCGHATAVPGVPGGETLQFE